MLPSARLVQGRFQDLDLICADNFARAAERAGVARIIYLGGILPADTAALSTHLASRLEVERVLGGRRPALTVLRAGLIIGAGGSSFEIVVRLVERLPAMLAPGWTSTPTQPIAVDDVVALLGYCVATPTTAGAVYDIAGPEVVSYRGLMQRVSASLRRRRRIIPLPIITPRLSALWISLITGAPRRLISPLIVSLRHEMLAGDRRLQEAAGIPGRSLDQAIADRAGGTRGGGADGVRRADLDPPGARRALGATAAAAGRARRCVGRRRVPAVVAARHATALAGRARRRDRALLHARAPAAAPGADRGAGAQPTRSPAPVRHRRSSGRPRWSRPPRVPRGAGRHGADRDPRLRAAPAVVDLPSHPGRGPPPGDVAVRAPPGQGADGGRGLERVATSATSPSGPGAAVAPGHRGTYQSGSGAGTGVRK
jgi:uncharacterized protein YbjT (DUF2867 family)